MEDAYLIGIRLALDNGVSAGVTVIRQDLAALDRAIAHSTAGLRQLQTLASQTTAASLGQMPRPSVQPTPLPRPTPEASGVPLTAPNATRPDAPAGDTMQPPRAMSQPGVVAPALRSTAPAASPGTPRINVTADVAGPVARGTAPPLQTGPQSPRTPPTKSPATAAAAPPHAAVRLPHSQRPAPPTGPATAQTPGTAQAPAAPSAQIAPIDTPKPRADHPPPVRSSAPDRWLPGPAPAAPRSTDTSAQSVPSRPIALPLQHSVAPQSTAAPQSPIGGDVFLDGGRLGHWLASTLAREAGRPPSGSTSFDPRLGISWPGAQQSGT